jgi:hypothetical protein
VTKLAAKPDIFSAGVFAASVKLKARGEVGLESSGWFDCAHSQRDCFVALFLAITVFSRSLRLKRSDIGPAGLRHQLTRNQLIERCVY